MTVRYLTKFYLICQSVILASNKHNTLRLKMKSVFPLLRNLIKLMVKFLDLLLCERFCCLF